MNKKTGFILTILFSLIWIGLCISNQWGIIPSIIGSFVFGIFFGWVSKER